jgi:hypothetical protein
MHRLSLVYYVIKPLHVSGVSAAHHQAVELTSIYVANGTCDTSELTVSGPGQLTVSIYIFYLLMMGC